MSDTNPVPFLFKEIVVLFSLPEFPRICLNQQAIMHSWLELSRSKECYDSIAIEVKLWIFEFPKLRNSNFFSAQKKF